MNATPALLLSLKSRALLGLLTLGLALVLLLGSWHVRRELRLEAEQAEASQLLLPLLYAEPLSRAVASNQISAVQRLLETMVSRHELQSVELKGRDGLRLVSGPDVLPGQDSPHSEFALRLPGEGVELGRVRVVSPELNVWGLLARPSMQHWLAQLLALALALGLGAAQLIDRLLLRPLRRMASDMERFDPSRPPSEFSWFDDGQPARTPAELQQINRAMAHVHQSVDQQLQRKQHEMRELSAQVAQQARALHEAQATLDIKQRELAQLARHDTLTGLSNRREFDDALRREFKRAQRQQSRLALAVLDLDHLKAYNELHGHAAGDELLRRFARLLGERFKRDTDLVARLGGEEFGALLPGFDSGSAQHMLESLREDWRRLSLPHGASPVDKMVTVSIGLAAYSPTQPYLSPLALMQAADEALYIAKHAGRDRLSLAA
ncbi:GGDEF domain-containing protein [Mitsuaria sp. WAJ17]|uniref:GGDEF domain-containing protein n=1 Tax=Mitsuaria sp. WAJ17 TaxID=2761452 RepID=UPI00160249BC|nr:GGDEF domain-containing protein [Mitsuaria sp. WAJ17]MBB2487956.1 GGDEF domain-containing protein [Mitsuaria sp. WAJ17]